MRGAAEPNCSCVGPSAPDSVGYCSENCCPGASDICVSSDNSDGLGDQSCCKHQYSGPHTSDSPCIAYLVFAVATATAWVGDKCTMHRCMEPG